MVSTRSGRVTSADTTSLVQRITRSRTQKESHALQEETAADPGQPEVTSPAPACASKVVGASPPQFAGFGSPLGAGHFYSTPVQQDVPGTPFQERVVKTIGKTPIAETPAVQEPSASAPPPEPLPEAAFATPAPSFKEVKQAAFAPLPDDAAAYEAEPFASSEDEQAVHASPTKVPTALGDSAAAADRPMRTGHGLLGVFAVSSVLVTALIALLLSPCLDQDVYLAMQSGNYERVCKSLVRIHHDAADQTQRLSSIAAGRISSLSHDLSPAALNAMHQAWASVKQAHVAAWAAASPLVAKAEEHVVPLWSRAQPALRRAFREAAMRVAPLLDDVMGRAISIVQAQRPVAPYPITCISFDDFMSVVDRASVSRAYLQELWDKAARDVASKQKAAVWLLTCGDAVDCVTAEGALRGAAARVIYINGPDFAHADAAGQLQHALINFLRAFPDGLVLVLQPEKLHPNSLSVLSNAASESGHLQMDGRPVSTKRALFVLLVEYPAAASEAGEPNADKEIAVKKWLTQSISAVASDDERTAAVVLSFRRRVDAVLPVRKLSGESGSAESIPTTGEAAAPSAAEPAQ